MSEGGLDLDELARRLSLRRLEGCPQVRLGPWEGARLERLAALWSPGCSAPLTLLDPAHRPLLEQPEAARWWAASPPAVAVFCAGLRPPSWWSAHQATLLGTADADLLLRRLRRLLPLFARWHSVHATLVQVAGRGLLLEGEPRAGKSETAWALLERGHRLVADDLVQVAALAADRLVGRAPDGVPTLHLRDLGVVDVGRRWGRSRLATVQPLQAIIRLHPHLAEKGRLLAEPETAPLAGVCLPRYHVRFRGAGDTARLVEALAEGLPEPWETLWEIPV